jgi:hypothetical protein
MATKLTSDDCKKYIVEWYAQNRTALPLFRFATPLDSKGGCGGLRNGLSKSSWSRQAIATIDNKIYRLFTANSTVIDPSVSLLLIEDSGKIESLTVGVSSDFAQYFGTIGYWA